MEDEPVEFEWDRLSELQRRNTLCLPHLKSSYPAEVQTTKPVKMSEADIRQGEPLNITNLGTSQKQGHTRKRSSTDMLLLEEEDRNRRKVCELT